MSIGLGYILHLKHATEAKWLTVGPSVLSWGTWRSKEMVERIAKFYQSLGLETRIETINVDYDDR